MRRHAPPYAPVAAACAGIVIIVWSPHDIVAFAARSHVAVWWAYAASVMFAAAPFAVGGPLVAIAARRCALPRPAIVALAIASPACDCSGSAFAALFARANPMLAAACMTWSALCNLPALVATWSAGGASAIAARAVAGAASACGAALVMRGAARLPTRGCDRGDGVCGMVGSALLGVAVTAAMCATMSAWLPHARGFAAQPLAAALAGAVLAPCSVADWIVARLLARTTLGACMFVIAAQTLSARHIVAMWRAFGPRGALAALVGATCGGLSAAAVLH